MKRKRKEKSKRGEKPPAVRATKETKASISKSFKLDERNTVCNNASKSESHFAMRDSFGRGAAGSKRGRGSILDAMKQRLQGGHFRWLNEQLYTTSGDDALKLMENDPGLYKHYHDGFREQTKLWPERPVDIAIRWLKSKPKSWTAIDLGCGDAEIASSVEQNVISYDLISTAPGVIACNMRSLPLETKSVDAAIFCLSLMGVDYGAFIEEAVRVLKPNGRLWIAEVQSRFVDHTGKNVLDAFIGAIESLGLELKSKNTKNSHFLVLEFHSNRLTKPSQDIISWPPLRPCLYKRR